MNKEDIKYIDNCAGIYYFKNNINNKYYIGQSVNIRKRIKAHIKSSLKMNNPLYKALCKYGLENFEFGILKRYDIIPKCILDFWEKYYIQYFNSYGNTGYNQTLGGDAGVTGLKMNIDQKNKIREAAIKENNDGRNDVYCYDTQTKDIIKTATLGELENKLNFIIHRGSLRSLLLHDRYIIARTEDKLNTKINNFVSCKNIKDKFNDVKNGMKLNDWMNKYKLSRSMYFKYKQKIK